MADISSLTNLEGLTGGMDSYQVLADTLGLSLNLFIFLAFVYFIWVIVWKGWGLWRSANKKKIAWFISFLIINTAGLFPLAYIFIFSKIKDSKSFRKIHDSLLIITLVFAGLTIWNIMFIIPTALLLGLFVISIIQEMVNRKEVWWLVLGILLMPIVPIIYYISKVREGKKLKFKKKR